jgi:cytochrome c-type biogenesis protein
MSQETVSLGLAFLAGAVTIVSPCVLPVLPLVLGRSLQSHRYGPVALVLGLVTGFAVAGSLLGIVASSFTELINGLRNFAIFLLLAIGILAIFPKLGYGLMGYLPVISTLRGLKPSGRVGLLGEFLLGSQLGLLWTPCAGPVLGSILILAAVKHQVLESLGLLLFYGLGAGLPLLAIAYAGRSMSQQLLGLRPYSLRLQQIGGVAIAATAIAILQGWDVEIQLWLAPLFPALKV